MANSLCQANEDRRLATYEKAYKLFEKALKKTRLNKCTVLGYHEITIIDYRTVGRLRDDE
jgi:hypothetical protein